MTIFFCHRRRYLADSHLHPAWYTKHFFYFGSVHMTSRRRVSVCYIPCLYRLLKDQLPEFQLKKPRVLCTWYTTIRSEFFNLHHWYKMGSNLNRFCVNEIVRRRLIIPSLYSLVSPFFQLSWAQISTCIAILHRKIYIVWHPVVCYWNIFS